MHQIGQVFQSHRFGLGEAALEGVLGVDAGALSDRDPMVMRDLERLCVSCTHKRKCAHELATGGAAEHFDEFCPNAYTLDMLLAERNRAPAAARR